MNNGRSYVEVAIARQLRLPAVMARGRAGRWPGAPRGKWRAHGIMRNAEGRINTTAIRRIIMFLNLTGPHRRVAGVRAVVAPHWPPPRPTGAGRAPARGSLARISMNPLPALPVVAHALIIKPGRGVPGVDQRRGRDEESQRGAGRPRMLYLPGGT